MWIEVTNEELQAVINALAMQHPLVRKLMEQVQQQQGEASGNLDAQRRAPDNGAGAGAAPRAAQPDPYSTASPGTGY